ncbi:MAG: hypothetical protein ACFUZC_08760 [Chthoniobacteraceae bacterium]
MDHSVSAKRSSLHPSGFNIKPGRLIRLGETLEFASPSNAKVQIRRGLAGDFAKVQSAVLTPSKPFQFTPAEPGMYLAEIEIEGERLRRPIAVVDKGWAVCQITVGAFTAEDFAETIHPAAINADYYIAPQRNGQSPEFTFVDPRWQHYEREFGDAIYPHVMANSLGALDPAMAHDDANWETLPITDIVKRLRFLQAWWEQRGFAPLDRIASYTPSNLFVEALKQTGIRILHSVVPEQNWSDGEWAINHWGMPTCPFWVAPDDFRKAGPRTPGGVLAMTMNHYHVLLPHLTMWGDFVLSPSHQTRWVRAADSGESSTRFRQFLSDTIKGWTSLSDDPFFFVAGFEFGRTFGTANMTDYNSHGLEALIQCSRTEKLVFANGNEVRAYFDRHETGHPETAFRQRDSWVGVTVNNKPGQAGDSVVLERRDYKAVIREGEICPFFHYDYLAEWHFATRDTHAPHDFSADDRKELRVRLEGETLRIEAARPLTRTIPLAIWDAVPEGGPFHVIRLPLLDDKRQVFAIEIPAGWSGTEAITLTPALAPLARRNDIWKMQTFGEGTNRHTYLHLDAPLTRNATVPVELKKRVRVDSATGTLGEQGPGTLELEFGLLQGWYRFWECGIDEIVPDAKVESKLAASNALLTNDWREQTRQHQSTLNRLAASRLQPGEKFVYQIYCGAELPLGTRSRADHQNQVTVAHPTLHAYEKADGVIAFGPGKSFWYHPRGLSFRIDGFPAGRRWKLLFHSFDPLKLDARYRIFVGSREAGLWTLPCDPQDNAAFFELELRPEDISAEGNVALRFATDQTQILHWWKDRGYIAALHALWVVDASSFDVRPVQKLHAIGSHSLSV